MFRPFGGHRAAGIGGGTAAIYFSSRRVWFSIDDFALFVTPAAVNHLAHCTCDIRVVMRGSELGGS